MITIPNKRDWYRLLSNRYSLQFAEKIINSASIVYQYLLAENSARNNNYRFIKKRIFPVLALYLAMQDHQLDQKTILLNLESFMMEIYFRIQLQGIKLLNYIIPDPFFIIKPVLIRSIQFSELPQGQVIKQNNPDCLAIDVHQCFIFDILRDLNAPELTAVFCASDDHLSAEMTKIEWKRTQTLGRGGEKCDFCWCRKRSSF
jgi:hypothetical protein